MVDTAFGWRQGPMRWSLKVNKLMNSWYQEVAGYNTPARSFLASTEYAFSRMPGLEDESQ